MAAKKQTKPKVEQYVWMVNHSGAMAFGSEAEAKEACDIATDRLGYTVRPFKVRYFYGGATTADIEDTLGLPRQQVLMP